MVLDAEGIPAILDNQHQAGFSGTFPIKVQVRAIDAERARDFIRAHEAANPEIRICRCHLAFTARYPL